MANHDYEPLNSLKVKKSNEMISAKYHSTLLENQVMSIALTRIEANVRDANGPLVAKLYPGELKNLIGDPAHIYRTLKTVSETMTGHVMIIEDGKGNFNTFSMVNNADYVDGVFTVRFNERLRPHILGLERNYTTLELSVLTSFKRNSSFRIYELLKREMYKSNPDVNNGMVTVEYNISELKFMIGLANSDDQRVKNERARMGNNIDWDDLYDYLDKSQKKYEEWRDFQKYVIMIAQKDLEETSNIRFDYKGIREGRKIKRIEFYVYPNTPKNNDIIVERQQIIESGKAKQTEALYLQYRELFDDLVGHNRLTRENVELFLKTAEYDEDKVRKAVEMADRQPQISSYVGWIKTCIEKDFYEEIVEVVNGSVETAEFVREFNDSRDDEMYAAKVRSWEKIKARDDFKIFLKEIRMVEEAYEDGFDLDERVAKYYEWHRNYNTQPVTKMEAPDLTIESDIEAMREYQWNECKKKKDFKSFLDDLDMTLEEYEERYVSNEKRIKLYKKWRE